MHGQGILIRELERHEWVQLSFIYNFITLGTDVKWVIVLFCFFL